MRDLPSFATVPMESTNVSRAALARLAGRVVPHLRARARSIVAIVVTFVCATLSAHAVEASAVLAFDVPPATHAVGSAKPACGDEIDVTRILADPSLYRALLGVDPDATLELDSSAKLLHQLAKYGRRTEGLAIHRSGQVASCVSGCAVLPRGARVREVRLSNRHDGAGVSVTGFIRSANPARGSQPSGSGDETDFINMGDDGYRGLRVTSGDRAVCVSAMNWSTTEASTQVVHVLFDR